MNGEDMSSEHGGADTSRRLIRWCPAVLAVVVASTFGLLGFTTESVSAAVTDYAWSSGCGGGTYGYHPSDGLKSLARMDYASRACGVKATVHCQRSSGATQWQIAATWQGLYTTSGKTCTSPYNVNRIGGGVNYQT